MRGISSVGTPTLRPAVNRLARRRAIRPACNVLARPRPSSSLHHAEARRHVVSRGTACRRSASLTLTMRILYGVTGEGMGHATRSKVVCEHLVSRGHEVKIVVSGRAHAFLARSFPDVVEIKGLSIRYVDNAMDRDGSLARNVLAAPQMLYANASRYFEDVVHFEPHVVISDFDSFGWFFAKRHSLPIVSIDNQQIIVRCKHDKSIKEGVKLDYQVTKAFVRAKLPGCDHY